MISTKVSASHRKSTQVHASPGQTESQVDPSFQLASTCQSVGPGLKSQLIKVSIVSNVSIVNNVCISIKLKKNFRLTQTLSNSFLISCFWSSRQDPRKMQNKDSFKELLAHKCQLVSCGTSQLSINFALLGSQQSVLYATIFTSKLRLK